MGREGLEEPGRAAGWKITPKCSEPKWVSVSGEAKEISGDPRWKLSQGFLANTTNQEKMSSGLWVGA